jgi:hypothetical protein
MFQIVLVFVWRIRVVSAELESRSEEEEGREAGRVQDGPNCSKLRTVIYTGVAWTQCIGVDMET